MKVQDLYDHIVKHMTPEQALMKLLEGSIINYQKLKFSQGEEVHPLFVITLAAMDMGWGIGVDKSDENIIGLMVGNDEYMSRHLKEKPNNNIDGADNKEAIEFAEWCANFWDYCTEYWIDQQQGIINPDKPQKFTTAQLLEKFRAMKPIKN